MRNQTMKISRKEAKPFIEAAFPEYRGRSIIVEFTESVNLHDLNWDGGTKNDYVFLDMTTSNSRKAPSFAPWNDPIEGKTITLPEGKLVICHKNFCGHDLGLTIYANPAQAKYLQAQS